MSLGSFLAYMLSRSSRPSITSKSLVSLVVTSQLNVRFYTVKGSIPAPRNISTS